MSLTTEKAIYFERKGRGAGRALASGPPRIVGEQGRVPRVARLLALALRFDGLLRQGVVADYAELASLGRVSRARISQIMNLLLLAPDIQEAILFLPRTLHGRDHIRLWQLQPLALALDWKKQRRLWHDLQRKPPSRRDTSFPKLKRKT
jgi:hypothetical protein